MKHIKAPFDQLQALRCLDHCICPNPGYGHIYPASRGPMFADGQFGDDLDRSTHAEAAFGVRTSAATGDRVECWKIARGVRKHQQECMARCLESA